MTSLMQAAPTINPIMTIVIKGALYDVEPIDAGFTGVAAIRLTKRSLEGETYDVVLTEDGRAECDCPSFEFTHRGTAGTCKHGAACLAKGLLIAPVVPVAVTVPRPVVAPITAKDVKRAAMWGLKLPVAPVVKPAPIAVEPVASAVGPVAPIAVAELAPSIPAPAGNPRDSWPAWTDPDRGTTEIDPDTDGPTPDPEPVTHSLADESWYAGFTLAMDGESPAYPMGESRARADRIAFLMGRNAGSAARLREIEADHDEIMGRDARFEAWVRHMEETEGVGEGPEYC